MDYLLTIPQSAPVPPSKDTGASYQTHIVSTGPYEFQSYQLNKTAVLVPNPQWNAVDCTRPPRSWPARSS